MDLFGVGDDDEDEMAKTFDRIDQERIDYHLREWNTTALDAVFGLLTVPKQPTRDSDVGSLKYICLFVNKIDKWTGGINERVVKDLFSPLIKDLRNRAKGHARFDVIIGSALRGTAVLGMNGSLMQKLFKYSVPLLKEDRHERQI